jgi:3-methyladenine DNA glycosylase AlkD
MSELKKLQSELRAVADPAKAEILARFFKTGPGEYGEGDRFHGVVVPKIRKVVKTHRTMPIPEIQKLLQSRYHEERLAALLILVEQYRRGDEFRKKTIHDLYLASTSRINSWDLVDLTAPRIVGEYAFRTDDSILTTLALSANLWERRIAMLATAHFIDQGDGRTALRISELLLNDSHDLIHKAVGWMLREVGKRCSMGEECRFLDRYAAIMPRTMLRYAIERFPEDLRKHYMGLGNPGVRKRVGGTPRCPKTQGIEARRADGK